MFLSLTLSEGKTPTFTSLKADEPQVGQRHGDEERKQEYYHIIFPERN
jgi:hypothetical protein